MRDLHQSHNICGGNRSGLMPCRIEGAEQTCPRATGACGRKMDRGKPANKTEVYQISAEYLGISLIKEGGNGFLS